jgi:hypothetical protein
MATMTGESTDSFCWGQDLEISGPWGSAGDTCSHLDALGPPNALYQRDFIWGRKTGNLRPLHWTHYMEINSKWTKGLCIRPESWIYKSPKKWENYMTWSQQWCLDVTPKAQATEANLDNSKGKKSAKWKGKAKNKKNVFKSQQI